MTDIAVNDFECKNKRVTLAAKLRIWYDRKGNFSEIRM